MNTPSEIVRSEIVRMDREITSILTLPESDAARRLMEKHRITANKPAFVAALIGRLLFQIHAPTKNAAQAPSASHGTV